MTDVRTTLISRPPWAEEETPKEAEHAPALVICWSVEPGRLGEVALLPAREDPYVLGRGEDDPDRLRFLQQGPLTRERAPLLAQGISRRQLEIRSQGEDALTVRNVGRCPMSLNGRRAEEGIVRRGDTVLLAHQLLLLCTSRPVEPPAPRRFLSEWHRTFGGADCCGIVGESPKMWQLREQVAYVARSEKHALILGESGTGKELVARAIHALSPRVSRGFIARSAATFPRELIDAELFGNAKNYPNPGMADRPGLIGEADGSILFLDEIGELPQELQAHLLRVLDQGEYARLGEARMRRADLVLLGATNRQADALKHDFAARFPVRVTVPGIGERREDVPLLFLHLLRQELARDRSMVEHFFSDDGEPRIEPMLMDWLVRRRYQHHVRELMQKLCQAIAGEGNYLKFVPEMEQADAAPQPAAQPRRRKLTADEIQKALDDFDGNQNRAWQELGLKNRFELYRLVRRHGLRTTREGGR